MICSKSNNIRQHNIIKQAMLHGCNQDCTNQLGFTGFALPLMSQKSMEINRKSVDSHYWQPNIELLFLFKQILQQTYHQHIGQTWRLISLIILIMGCSHDSREERTNTNRPSRPRKSNPPDSALIPLHSNPPKMVGKSLSAPSQSSGTLSSNISNRTGHPYPVYSLTSSSAPMFDPYMSRQIEAALQAE